MPTGFAKLISNPLLDQCSQSTASSSAHRSKRNETLKTLTALRHPPHSVQRYVNHFTSQTVVAAREITRRILLASNECARIKQRAVAASPYFVYRNRLEVDKHHPRHAFESASWLAVTTAEESVRVVVEVVVLTERAIGLDSMLQAVKFPAGTCDLSKNRTEFVRRMKNELNWVAIGERKLKLNISCRGGAHATPSLHCYLNTRLANV